MCSSDAADELMESGFGVSGPFLKEIGKLSLRVSLFSVRYPLTRGGRMGGRHPPRTPDPEGFNDFSRQRSSSLNVVVGLDVFIGMCSHYECVFIYMDRFYSYIL